MQVKAFLILVYQIKPTDWSVRTGCSSIILQTIRIFQTENIQYWTKKMKLIWLKIGSDSSTSIIIRDCMASFIIDKKCRSVCKLRPNTVGLMNIISFNFQSYTTLSNHTQGSKRSKNVWEVWICIETLWKLKIRIFVFSVD